MGTTNVRQWATTLHEARVNAAPIEQLSKTEKFSRADAYAIQEEGLRLRLASGETQVGWKMGLTSEAKRRQMNLDSPLYGVLTDKMQIADGGTYTLKGSIHSKIEPEIAFLMKHDLKGDVTREQALAAVDGVAACMEILDSRYTQFKYFSMEDVIADNSSSSHFVVGEWDRAFHHIDLKNLSMRMFVGGAEVQKGNSADISGDPVVSVVQLCALLAERDQILKAGSIVLAGAATAAVEIQAGMRVDLRVKFLNDVSVWATGQ